MTRWAAHLVLGVLFGLVASTAFAGDADARPGGGHSFSGGGRSSGGSYRSSSSSSSSSGGGGGGGVAAMVLILGLGVMIVVGVAASEKASPSTGWTSATMRPARSYEVDALRIADPAFSQIEFEDFAFNLFARAHRARANPAALEELTPYLAADIAAQLVAAPPVSQVVIGSLRLVSVLAPQASAATNSIAVRVEANLATPGGTTNVIELWTFARAANVKSRTPDKTRTFPCPNCNAPFKRGDAERTCAHCNTAIVSMRFDWTVIGREIGAETGVGLTLTGTVAEVGNDLTTIVDPNAFTAMQALYEADKNVSWEAFDAHVRMIYHRLNDAWNAQDLAPVRGLVTYSLLGYLKFWIDEYKLQQLTNRLDDAKVERIALAKVVRDGTYDAVTVRVFADGIDYTHDTSNNVVGGSRTSRRAYTEYWTLIRSSTRKGPIVNEPKCPNCGAPLAISDSGDCTHCKATIENGSFDWVLSKIEQDEVYVA